MSKVDWQDVASRHDRSPETDFPEWLQAIEELRTSEDSRQEAIDTDPLMMFQGLPEGDSSEHEIESMKQAVAQLRRVGDLPSGPVSANGLVATFGALMAWLRSATETWNVHPGGWRGSHGWQAAAALLLISVAAWWLQPWSTGLEDGAVQAAVSLSPAMTAPAMIEGLAKPGNAPWVPADLHHQPLVEDAGPSAGELIQIEDAEVSLVVVLPRSSDSEV